MTKARLEWLREPGNHALVRHGLRGLEKESLRVTADAGVLFPGRYYGEGVPTAYQLAVGLEVFAE